MKPSEKRTRTEPGLGKVTAETRRTTMRERVLEPPTTESAPIRSPGSGAPPSGSEGGPASGPPGQRHTRAIESSRPHVRESLGAMAANQSAPPASEGSPPSRSPEPSQPPPTARVDSRPPSSERRVPSQPIERIERNEPSEPSRSASDRSPIDVTHVDPKRLARSSGTAGDRTPEPKPVRTAVDSRPIVQRFESEERPTGRRAIEGRRTLSEEKLGGSRTVDGRPVSSRPGEQPRRSVTSRPPAPPVAKPSSQRPNRGPSIPPPGRSVSSKPPGRRRGDSLPPPSAAEPSRIGNGTARSRRVSIREDNVGDAVNRAPDAVGAAGGPSSRSVPRLVKSKAEIAAAPIDHRAGFLLAHIDGTTNVQGLVDIAGMAENEVHEILDRLRRLGIVAIR